MTRVDSAKTAKSSATATSDSAMDSDAQSATVLLAVAQLAILLLSAAQLAIVVAIALAADMLSLDMLPNHRLPLQTTKLAMVVAIVALTSLTNQMALSTSLASMNTHVALAVASQAGGMPK